jgi:hypothetical protein
MFGSRLIFGSHFPFRAAQCNAKRTTKRGDPAICNAKSSTKPIAVYLPIHSNKGRARVRR